MNDTQAMDTIARLLSFEEWSPDTLNQVADVVRMTCRKVLDPSERNSD